MKIQWEEADVKVVGRRVCLPGTPDCFMIGSLANEDKEYSYVLISLSSGLVSHKRTATGLALALNAGNYWPEELLEVTETGTPKGSA